MIQMRHSHLSTEMKSASNKLSKQAHKALQDLISKDCLGHEMTGWFNWPAEHGFDLLNTIDKQIEASDVDYDVIVNIGVGGSYLGTRAISEALAHEFSHAMPKDSRRLVHKPIVYAGHHLSESGLRDLLDYLETRQPILNIISKSGTTTEPGVVFRVLNQYMEQRFGSSEAKKRILATTDPKDGGLRQLADERQYVSFDIPSNVGGRFSVLTAVGMVPLSLAGYSVQKIMQGADQCFKELLESVNSDHLHPALEYACVRIGAWETGKRIDVLSFNEPKLKQFSGWWQQLFAESEGKNGLGMFPTSLTCTTDLHSIGQYLQDGCRNLIETFLFIKDPTSENVLNDEFRIKVPQQSNDLDSLGYLQGRYLSEINEAAMIGTQKAHGEGGVPTIELSIAKLDEWHLGYMIAFMEVSCAISCSLLGVNPFNQPGVENYKQELFRLMGKPQA